MLKLKLPIFLLAATLSLSAQTTVTSLANLPSAALPASFSGWQLSGEPTHSTDPSFRSKDEASWLKEDGFLSGAQAAYQRDGETLKLSLFRFTDVSGAYSAYTLLRQPNWPKEEIGTGATSDNNRVLFWQSNLVVDATFSHVSAMSAGELRDLAKRLPVVNGNAGLAPPITHYLPQGGLIPQTTRYSLGAVTYMQGGGALPPAVIGFDRGAEVLSGHYLIQGNEGVLTLVEYPTPQAAIERETAINAFFKAGNSKQNPWPQPLADSNPLALTVHRSGPVLAITTGGFFDRQAQELAGRVYYQAEVSWTRSGSQSSEISKTAQLLIGIVMMVAILGGTSLILGIFFGGGRMMWRRLRGKSILDEPEKSSFVRLNISGDSENPFIPKQGSNSSSESDPKANG